MLELLWLIPALPLAGFLVLALAGARLPRAAAAAVGVGSVGASAILAAAIGASFIAAPPAGHACRQLLWNWIDAGGFTAGVALYLDPLALVMVLVVTGVGFLIHLYSSEFMRGDQGYSRFFAYMNLFVASMLTLVLADNLLLLYLGWEGVGLCSYLLIGFWYQDPANGAAARKAFIVTRIGDTAMAVGLILLVQNLGTLEIQEMMGRALARWPAGSSLAVAAAALLLGGALGKSAQLPLQTWLPDAMAGPTPTSALIHAATMVTAGVYLIARTNVLFTLAPPVQAAVGLIGALTLLLAGFSALAQRDIKRVLAYSTISQVGYMFLALGVGAYSAALFHFVTHALFKALLFLGAGVVILALEDEHDMFKMGGLRRQLPLTFWTFLAGAASLSALPLVTAGFYSKDLILCETWSSGKGSPWLWAAGLLGALVTSLYTFRMLFLTFFGQPHGQVHRRPGLCVGLPLVVLAVLSVGGGVIELPAGLGNLPLLSGFLEDRSLPPPPPGASGMLGPSALQAIAAAASLLGIYLAYRWFLRRPSEAAAWKRSPWAAGLGRLWLAGWGFDWLYDRALVRPYLRLANAAKDDFIDLVYAAAAWAARAGHAALSATQTGLVRKHALGIAIGAAILLIIVIFL
jgi:NADH-quinone oxidoreductase subunit L